ncbi:hypothetical protein SLS56_010868 [Neofusicoccum ribis]|uniref:Transcription factor domain-containing protein n=1 Tax=Neofusicoccum ribis TaxID=45134 RepID=A0ABR3SDN0_9PEZI
MFQDKGPPVLQDALSACALYCLKNRENQTLVLRNVEQKAQQLVASTDTLLLSTAELLFSVQALLLYQIIRLFDGDIRLRAQAEADEATLMAWTVHLKAHMQQVVPSLPPSAGALSPVQVTAPDWHRWLVKESIRRTVFTAFTLKGVYDYLKYGSDEESGRIHRLCYTAQAALWDAQSENGWRAAYCEQERLELRMESFNEDIAKATPGDLEELSLIVLAIYWGVETVEEWLGKHHAARHGLEV